MLVLTLALELRISLLRCLPFPNMRLCPSQWHETRKALA